MQSNSQPLTRRGHLNLAADFAADAWFPGDRGVATEAASIITAQPESFDREKLITTVKADFSVFAYTALNLSRKARLNQTAELLDDAPVELIRKASVADLSEVLRHAAARCGGMPNGVDINFNNLRIRHAIVSASSAELLAQSFDVDPQMAYTCALFRQIGSALIAWNYPQAWRRALTLVREDTPIDSIIGKILGFTPSLLGLTIAHRWGIAPELLRGMGDTTIYNRAKESAVLNGERLQELCTLGETIAQATEPAAYPAAVKMWPQVRATVERRVGPDAFARLRDSLAYNARVYLAVEPPIFKLPLELLEPSGDTSPRAPTSRFGSNLFAQRCPEPLQALFRDLYVSIDRGARESALTALMNSIAPTAGFKGGCVFIHEADTDLLKPRFTAGDLRPVDYPTFRLRGEAADPVTVTFLRVSSHEPLRDGSSITGALGETPHAGVLKLVAGPELRALPSAEIDLLFRAFRRALEDCLELT
jgi:hypothetical protein